MSEKNPNLTRRRFLGLSGTALAAIPVVAYLGSHSRGAQAAGMPHVTSADPQAKALQYTDNAKTAKRPSANEFCHDCGNFEGKAGAAWGPCKIFPGKEVNKNGWCVAWVKKTA